ILVTPPCDPEGSLISLALSMPCKLASCGLILLALADAVGYRVQVRSHHVQLVGPELLAPPGPEDIRVPVVELDDELADAVGVHTALRHIERAAPPVPVSFLQPLLPSVRAPANLTSKLERPQAAGCGEQRSDYECRQH